jgi:predicted outer membrane repeat protein
VAAAACLSSGSALAATAPAIVRVPCSAAALANDISAAVSGQTLNLAASCRYLLNTALPDISVNLIIDGNDATLQRSHAPGTADFSLLVLSTGPDSTSTQDVAISHLNFRNGDSEYGGALDAGNPGAGITVTVTGGSFTGNTATAAGGAVYLSGVGSPTGPGVSVTVTRASFVSNTAAGGGGAIAGDGEGGYYHLTVTRDTFTRNTAGGGGAIENEAGLTVNGGTFTSNTAGWGGAIDSASDNAAGMTVNDATFTRNTATFKGGALYNWDGLKAAGDTFNRNSAEIGGGIDNEWSATVSGTTFRGNTATTDGGGMFSGYQAAVSDSSFDQNQAGSGGGIDNGPGDLGLTATMSVTGSHLTGNHAEADGGGIGNGPGEVEFQVRSTISIASTSITANTATSDGGGGIYTTQTSTVTLTTSTVDKNHPDNCAPPDAVAGCST